MTNFEIPRLRVKLARTLQKYTEYIKKPLPFLKDFHTDLAGINISLALRCEEMLVTSAPKTELDAFLDDLKIFLAENGGDILSTIDEAKLNENISVLAGLGEKLASALEDFGRSTVKDVLFGIPMRYEVLSEELHEGRAVLSGKYQGSKIVRTRQGKQIFQAVFASKNGYFTGVWLHFNKQYPQAVLKEKEEYYLYGSLTRYNGAPSIFHPELLNRHEVGSVRSVYSLPAKVSQKIYHKALEYAFDVYMPYVCDSLPESLRFKYRYPEIHDALTTLHFPKTQANSAMITSRKHPAFQRLVYEELFYLQIRLLLKKLSYVEIRGIEYDIPRSMLEEIVPLMPFKMTDSQRHVIKDIFADMRSSKQMNRLLQGDVGSGKTIVAFVCAVVAVKNGYQAVILAPTEVLAEQHYHNLSKFLLKSGINACLLTGSTKQKDKKIIKENIALGTINIIVGTHALIQEDVTFNRLGFAVIDEQHRFGVKQRKMLMDKGVSPDILLMTATPIPRTLALTYYGDLDISEIAGMPPGRIPPVTKAYRGERLKDALAFVKEHLKDGEKAYFVYPAIEESEKVKLKSVTKNVDVVKKAFPNKSVGLLHGKMKADEKRAMLDEFSTGSLDILVSTTVVEVGVDVKDATVIVIENADRFGLAQLHQLRGRVGRNDKQSYCVLVASEETSETGFRRLRAMEQFTSGFKLAELDLELRGQGDFFGVKQSGMPEFIYADILADGDILKAARNDAQMIIDEDAHLEMQKNALIRSVIMQRWQDEYNLFLVG